MVQVKRPPEESARPKSEGREKERRDFPPLGENVHSSKERWDLIQTEMARHQDVLAELADS